MPHEQKKKDQSAFIMIRGASDHPMPITQSVHSLLVIGTS